MANEINQFNRSLEKWTELTRDGHLSAPSSTGRPAIMFDWVPQSESDPSSRYQEQEAIRLQKCIYIHLGRKASMYDSLSEQAFGEVLTDDSVSDVIIIGHGTFSTIDKDFMDKGHYSWYKAAQAADHLKTGQLVQRTCGKFTRNRLPIPFGMFVVDDHRNIRMPFNEYFSPETNVDAEEKIQPITKHRRLKLKTILDWEATQNAR